MGLLGVGATVPPEYTEDRLFNVNYFGVLATIILAGSGATRIGVESMVMA